MESSQWNKLPVDLLIRVLSRLPILDLRKLSLTCRYFLSLVLDPSFALHYDRSFVGHPMFFLMSDLIEKRTQPPSLKSTIWQAGRLANFTWRNPLLHDLPEYRWRMPVTYGDGFMCFEGFVGPNYLHDINHENTRLLVVNPIFCKESRILSVPAMANSVGRFYTGIAFDRTNGVCKLILWHISQASNSVMTTFVYNFKESVWKKLPEWNGIPNNGGSSFVMHRDRPQLVSERYLCWLLHSFHTTSPADRVLVFDVEEDKWMDPVPFPQLPRGEMLFSFIFEHKRALCIISNAYEKLTKILAIWKFHMEERVWRRAESIPPPPFRFRDVFPPEMTGRGFWGFESGNFSDSRVSIFDMSNHGWKYVGKFQSAIVMEPSVFRLVY